MKRKFFQELAVKLRRGTKGPRTDTPPKFSFGKIVRADIGLSNALWSWTPALRLSGWSRKKGLHRQSELLKGDHDLHAPRLMVSEIANALWRKARLGEIGHGEAGVLAAAVREMPLRWSDDERVCADAVRLALALGKAGLRLRVLGARAPPSAPRW